jgi:hypothetical protein
VSCQDTSGMMHILDGTSWQAGLRLFVDGILESFAGGELDGLGCGNLDFFAGARIAAGALCAAAVGKCAETDDLDGVTTGDGVDDLIQDRLNGTLCRSLGQIALGGDGINQFSFVHATSKRKSTDSSTIQVASHLAA